MTLISLLLFSFYSGAIDHLPCQRALTGSIFEVAPGHTVELKPNQILVRGKLEAYLEEGREEQIYWSISDQEIFHKISQNRYDALFELETGDQVYLLDEQGNIQHQGYYVETTKPGAFVLMRKKVGVHPNRPMLIAAAGSSERVIPSRMFAAAFRSGQRAVVIQTLSDGRLKELDKKLTHPLKAYWDYSATGAKHIPIGHGEPYALAYFETALTGRLSVTADGVVFLEAPDGRAEPLHYFDRIILTDSKGLLVRDFRPSRWPLRIRDAGEELLSPDFHATIVRRGS